MENKPFVEIPTQTGREIINPEELISIVASNKTIILCLENQEEKKVNLPFGKALELFNHPFMVKCHRSHIINILKVKEILCKQKKIKLTNGKLLPISENCKKEFEQRLSAFCKCKGGGNVLVIN